MPKVGQRIQHSRTSPTLSRSVARKYSQPRPAFQSGTIVGCRMLTIVSSCSRAQSSINRCPRRRETMLKTMAKLMPRTAQMPNRIQISASLNDEKDVGIFVGLTMIRPRCVHGVVHGCFHVGLCLSWGNESGLANFCQRLFSVLADGHQPKSGRPVSLTRLMTALRKSLVKST